MKKILLIMLLLPAISFGQKKIKINTEIDKFSNEKQIRTSEVETSPLLRTSLKITFVAQGESMFIIFSGKAGVGVVSPNDPTFLRFEDNLMFGVFPVAMQSYEGYGDNAYFSQKYIISKDHIEDFKNIKLLGIRRFFNNKYIDIDVPKESAERLNKLASMFLEELNK